MNQWLISALAFVVIVAAVAAFEFWRASRLVPDAYEPTETGVLPLEPVIIPMPPVRPTKGRRPF